MKSIIAFGLGKQVVELDLKTVVPCCSGPKRPQDKVAVSEMKRDFESCLGAKVWPLDSPCALGSRLHIVVNLPEAWCQGHVFYPKRFHDSPISYGPSSFPAPQACL